MKRLIIVFAVNFILIGCMSKVVITPEKLPNATVGTAYYAEIKIDSGSGPISSSRFERYIYPENSGLEIIFPEINGRVEYNNMTVQGTPKLLENITIVIKGAMIPTGWHASSAFEKTYIIKVKQ